MTLNTELRTQVHEFGHILGAACGAVAVDLSEDTYAATVIKAKVNGIGDGEVIASTPDFNISKQLAALAAIGPVGVNADPLNAIRKADSAAIQKAGDLSSQDLALIKTWDGGATVPAVTALAVWHLRQKLGVSKTREMARMISTLQNQHETLNLPDWVPFDVAKQAVAAAKTRLLDAMDPPITRAQAQKMKIADVLERRVK